MKRVWKRAAALFMMFVVVLAMGVTAGADSVSLTVNSNNVVTNTTSVEITGVPTDTTVNYTTYQVVYATYDLDTNELTWHLSAWAITALTTDWNGDSTALCTDEDAALEAVLALIGTDGTGILGQSKGTSAIEQNTIVNTLAAYVANDSTSITAYSVTWETDSGTSTATLPVGSYLVIPSATGMSFLNMLVSVDVSDTTTSGSTSASGWVITAKGAVLKGTSLSVTKTVSDSGPNGPYADSASAQVGDTLYYWIQVSVPQFAVNDGTHKFVVTDTATNLAIDVNSVVVTGYPSGSTTGTILTAYNNATDETSNAPTAAYSASVTNDGSNYTLTVSFTDYYNNTDVFYTTDNSTGATTYNYDYVIITYQATLLSSAAVVSDSSTSGNSNKAELTYDYDNNNNSGTSTVSDGATVYTYGLNLTKYDDGSGTAKSALSNATFKIYYYETVNETTTKYYLTVSGSDGSYTVTGIVAENNASGASTGITTSTSGSLSLTGLDADKTYYIEETTAPSGYSLNTSTLAFQITDYDSSMGAADGKIDLLSLAEYSGTVSSTSTATYTWTDVSGETNTITSSTASSTEGKSWSAARNSDDTSGSTTYDGYLKASVTDTKISALPATGSVGIIIFTIAGVAIMILALVLINSGKSKQKKA